MAIYASSAASGSGEQRASSAAPWFARTKFRQPRPRADMLLRPRLTNELRQALATARLTLLSAPAGSGKTTLLSQIADCRLQIAETPNLQSTIYNLQSLAWLSLDQDDNDPMRWLHALVTAFQQVLPAQGAAAVLQQAMQAAPGRADSRDLGRQVINALVNDLAEAPGAHDDPATAVPGLVLVLDDLHVITESLIFELLNLLIERLPPGVSLVITTRHDPPLALARLRAQRELVELRLPDLRFTSDEVQTLLNERLGLALPSEQVAQLYQRTEGWAAGLSLLAASLDRIAEPAARTAFLRNLDRTDRQMFEYLAEEVLSRQDAFVQIFLLETAILPELSPTLCAAVTGRTDAAAILADLYRRNLFLTQIEADEARPSASEVLPASRSTYRYHDLFRDFLHNRLQRESPEWLSELHRRAAQAETIPARRIQHALLGAWWEDAADLIEIHGAASIAQGALSMLRGWLTHLPAAVLAGRPRLLLWLGICEWSQFAFDASLAHFAQALAGFEAASDLAGQAEALIWMCGALNLYDDFDAAQALVMRTLSYPLAPAQRGRLLTSYALGLTIREQWQAGLAALDQALALAETSNDPQVALAIAGEFQAPLSVIPGGVARAERALRLVEQLPHTSEAAMGRMLLRALTDIWRGNWDEMMAFCRQLFAQLEQSDSVNMLLINVGGYVTLDMAIRGGPPETDRALDILLDLERFGSDAFTRSVALSYQFHYARAQWLRGNYGETRRIHQLLAPLTASGRFQYVMIIRLLLAGLVAQADGRYADAEAAWLQAAELQDQTRFSILFADAHVLLAALDLLQGHGAPALARFMPRLAEYAEHNTPGLLLWQGAVVVPLLKLVVARGPYADFASRTLALFSPTAAPPPAVAPLAAGALRVPSSGEVLTAREVEVLRLLVAGASNQAIAEQLVISVHTVKLHVAHLLAKLQVASRTEAAVMARELGVSHE